MKQYAEEVKQAAKSLYLRRYKISEIAEELNIPKRTLHHWADVENWNDLTSHETVEEATKRRLVLLIDKMEKTAADLKEVDALVSVLERLQRMAWKNSQQQEEGGQSGQGKSAGGKTTGKGKRSKVKNDVSKLKAEDFKRTHKKYFDYQKELRAARHYRSRMLLKSRQIGATWYFAQEAFEDAVFTGDNQIFLSATRRQADVFRRYITAYAKQEFGLELKGKDVIELNTAHGIAELHFLSSSSTSAQSYHGHVYLDEFFWMRNFDELYKVASGMAMHKKWRKTLFSTPSAVGHQAYPRWNGDLFNTRWKKKRMEFPGFKAMQSGILCPDKTWRKIITIKDAMAGGCDLFDIEELKLEYSPEEFANLLMCRFVDDALSVFKLKDLEACFDDQEEWEDYSPLAARPFGNMPVWCGYDPSRSRDDASFVVIAPPLKEGGNYRVLLRMKWANKSFVWQAERIKEICEQFNVQYMGIDVTGPGMGVFDIVRSFFPLATPINYSVESKTRIVLKLVDVIGSGRMKWDAAHTDIPHAFLTIHQIVTGSGNMTYAADRTSKTGHADVAFAIGHALINEPLNTSQASGGCLVIG